MHVFTAVTMLGCVQNKLSKVARGCHASSSEPDRAWLPVISQLEQNISGGTRQREAVTLRPGVSSTDKRVICVRLSHTSGLANRVRQYRRKNKKPTIIGDRFWSTLITSVVIAFLVLGLPRVVDLEAAVELLSAGRQQLDVCQTTQHS